MAYILFLLVLSQAWADDVLTLRWNELQGAVAKRDARVILTDGREVKGVIASVAEDAVVMEKAASERVARGTIREIRVRKVKGPRRAIFAGGIGAGVALGTLPWAISDSRVNVSDGARIAQWSGITAGAAIAGYFVGRHLDTKEMVIRIASGER